MSTPDPWFLLERLHDPATPSDERRTLEREIAADPERAERLGTFRILADWSALEAAVPLATQAGALVQLLEYEYAGQSLDREIRRTFPYVAALALAAAIALAAINLGSVQDFTHNTIDALFGLPQTTLDDTLLANL